MQKPYLIRVTTRSMETFWWSQIFTFSWDWHLGRLSHQVYLPQFNWCFFRCLNIARLVWRLQESMRRSYGMENPTMKQPTSLGRRFLQLPNFGKENNYISSFTFCEQPTKKNISSRLRIFWPFPWEVFDATKKISQNLKRVQPFSAGWIPKRKNYHSGAGGFNVDLDPTTCFWGVWHITRFFWRFYRKLKSLWKTWICDSSILGRISCVFCLGLNQLMPGARVTFQYSYWMLQKSGGNAPVEVGQFIPWFTTVLPSSQVVFDPATGDAWTMGVPGVGPWKVTETE